MIKYVIDKIEPETNSINLKILEDIDVYNSENFYDLLNRELYKKQNIKNFVIDFKSVKFLSSSGLGVIAHVYRLVSPELGSITLINVSNNIKRLFDITGFSKFIKIEQ